jgi:hypothetical protein
VGVGIGPNGSALPDITECASIRQGERSIDLKWALESATERILLRAKCLVLINPEPRTRVSTRVVEAIRAPYSSDKAVAQHA